MSKLLNIETTWRNLDEIGLECVRMRAIGHWNAPLFSACNDVSASRIQLNISVDSTLIKCAINRTEELLQLKCFHCPFWFVRYFMLHLHYHIYSKYFRSFFLIIFLLNMFIRCSVEALRGFWSCCCCYSPFQEQIFAENGGTSVILVLISMRCSTVLYFTVGVFL